MSDTPHKAASPKIGSDSQLMAVAWGMTVALAVAADLTATRALSLLQWAVFAALLCPALIPFLWQAARPLRTYAGMLVLLTLLAVFFWNGLPAWMSRQPWFPNSAGYAAAFIMQSPKLVAAFVMLGVLALRGYRRQEFFCRAAHTENCGSDPVLLRQWSWD